MSVEFVESARLRAYSMSGVSYYLGLSSISLSSEIEALRNPIEVGAIAIAFGLESA
jgi:hypothetical protein